MPGAVQQLLSYVYGVRRKGVDKKPRAEIKLWTTTKKKTNRIKKTFSRKNHFYSMVYRTESQKNKYPSKANEIFENKWKMKINSRINTIKTNQIEVFTILTVLRFKLFADISRMQ